MCSMMLRRLSAMLYIHMSCWQRAQQGHCIAGSANVILYKADCTHGCMLSKPKPPAGVLFFSKYAPKGTQRPRPNARHLSSRMPVILNYLVSHQSRVLGDHKAGSRNRHAGMPSKQLVGVPELILFLLCGTGSGTLIMHSFLS